MMDAKFWIPPTYISPEPDPPPAPSDFRKRPAQHIFPGDLMLLGGCVWRVKARHTLKSGKIVFTLWPVSGGRPASESFYPREWVASLVGW